MIVDYILNQELLPVTALTTDLASDAFPVSGRCNIGVVVKWASLTGTLDAEFFLEASNDGTAWGAITTPVVVSGASASDAIQSTECFFNYVRLAVTQNNVTGGNISASISLFR